MELLKLDTNIFKDKEDWQLTDISISKIYYLSYNRNAWHSTRIKRFWEQGSFHTTLQSAMSKAEKERTQGNQFVIREMPAFAFHSNKGAIIQILFEDILKSLQDFLLTKFVYDINTYKVFILPKFSKGSKFSDLFFSETIENIYFSDFFYFLEGNFSKLEPYPKDTNPCSYTSFSIGGDYRLQWSKNIIKFNYLISHALNFIETFHFLRNGNKHNYHYVHNFRHANPSVIKNNRYILLSRFLKSSSYPNSKEIWLSGIDKNQFTGFFLNKILNNQDIDVIYKKSNQRLCSPDWWRPSVLRVDLPSIFYFIQNVQPDIQSGLHYALINVIQGCLDYLVKTDENTFIITTNNASLGLIHINIYFTNIENNQNINIEQYASYISNSVIKIINSSKKNYKNKDRTVFYIDLNSRIPKHTKRTLSFLDK